jgi:16S rRNA processing protein RimM
LAPEFVTVARVRRSQGRRGEVAAELLTDFPERFRPGCSLHLWKEGQPRRTVSLEGSWLHKGSIILKFAGVGDISGAQDLAGWEVQVPFEERMPLPGEAVYLSDLEGCQVVEKGQPVGTIRAVNLGPGAPLLVVDTPRGELLVPFVPAICRRVDVAAKVVEVELPEGLRELNEG